MAEQKLTDRQSLSTSSDSSLIHVVEGGVSYKQTKANFLKEDRVRISNLESADVTQDSRIDNLEENQYSGVVVYETLADLPATGTLLVSYKVSNDSTSSNNGYYHWNGSAYVKDASLANGVIEEGNVDAVSGGVIDSALDYKADLIVGKNIMNKDTFISGFYISSTGVINADADKNLSEYIKVTPSTDYVCNKPIRTICFFDVYKNVTTGGTDLSATSFTTSADTNYIRISWESYYFDNFDLQLEEGTISTTYENYYKKVEYSQLPIPLYLFDKTNEIEYVSPLSIDKYYQNPDVNLKTYSEDLSNTHYSVTFAVKGNDFITYKGIKLTKLTSSSFYASLKTNFSGNVLPIFETGEKYLISCYVLNLSNTEQFIWTKYLTNSSSNAHAPKLIDGKVRRIWSLVQATSPTSIDVLQNPELNYGDSSDISFYWMFQGSTGGAGLLDLRIGGFSIEKLDDNTYVDGVALIGDSTMAGSSGSYDRGDSREVSSYAAALLNCQFFNRAVGGERTDQMDARWATDITPLSQNCKYAIIQGGINDIAQSRALADIKTSFQSMYDKAVIDGMIPIVMTCTPTSSIAADPSKEADRLALNIWLKTTFPLCLDIASIVADPSTPSVLRSEWAGDGTHYDIKAKRAIANAISNWEFWDFKTPKPYQQLLTTTPTLENPFDRKIGEIHKIQGISIFAESNNVDLSGRYDLI